MRQRQVRVTATTTAPPDTVFRLLADGATWTAWAPIDALELEREGDPPPEGVGAIRVLHRGRTTGPDEILELDPGRRFRYRSRSGLPVRDYVGEVVLNGSGDGGTNIRWQSTFIPRVPGTGGLLVRGITRFLDGCATGLADFATTASGRVG